MIRISKDYPIYITGNPKEENQINREQEKLNIQVRKAFLERKIRLILKEKILGKTGSKSQTKTDFIKHNNPVGIHNKKKQPIC